MFSKLHDRIVDSLVKRAMDKRAESVKAFLSIYGTNSSKLANDLDIDERDAQRLLDSCLESI